MPELRWKSRIEYAFGLVLSFVAYFLSYENEKIQVHQKARTAKTERA